MVKLFYATKISKDLAHHEIIRAKVDKGGIIVPNTKCLDVVAIVF